MTRKLGSFNFKSLTLLVLAVSITAVIFSSQQQAQASMNAGDAGWQQGKNDKLANENYNPRCPDGLTDAQCSFYRTGYAAGWAATSIIRPDNEPERNYDFQENNDN